MSGYIRRGANLFDSSTGAWVGVVDPLGNEQLLSGISTGGTASAFTPATGYAFALRASQASYGTLIDQGPNQRAFLVNAGLIPIAFTINTVMSSGQYRTPVTLNGLVYRCSTPGTTGGTELAWGTTVGGTTTQGTAVFTCEKGPYTVDSSGIKLFRSLASAQTGQASVFQPSTTPACDMATDSFMLNLRIKQDWNASGQAAAAPIFSTSLNGTGPGVRVRATGSTLQDARIEFVSGSGSILSGDTSAGYPFKPFDGTERNLFVAYDAPTKIAYCGVGGAFLTQSDMFNGGALCPNGMNLVTLTGSKVCGLPTIGGDPGSATSYECAFKTIDYIVLSGTGLPANIQNVASFFARGGEALLPQSMAV